jgi:hypothetical protein
MRLLGKVLPLLLSLVLAIEIASAFVPRTLSSIDGLAIQLCADGGVQTVIIDPETGNPMEDQIVEGHCPLCVIGMATLCPSPTVVPVALRLLPQPAFLQHQVVQARIILLSDSIRAPPEKT